MAAIIPFMPEQNMSIPIRVIQHPPQPSVQSTTPGIVASMNDEQKILFDTRLNSTTRRRLLAELAIPDDQLIYCIARNADFSKASTRRHFVRFLAASPIGGERQKFLAKPQRFTAIFNSKTPSLHTQEISVEVFTAPFFFLFLQSSLFQTAKEASRYRSDAKSIPLPPQQGLMMPPPPPPAQTVFQDANCLHNWPPVAQTAASFAEKYKALK